MKNTLPVFLMALSLAACDPPEVHATQDKRQRTESSRIAGEVTITSRARGNVVLFLFRADRPPPPEGTGRPIAFTILNGESVFGSALGDETRGGPFSAPFSFTLVP